MLAVGVTPLAANDDGIPKQAVQHAYLAITQFGRIYGFVESSRLGRFSQLFNEFHRLGSDSYPVKISMVEARLRPFASHFMEEARGPSGDSSWKLAIARSKSLRPRIHSFLDRYQRSLRTQRPSLGDPYVSFGRTFRSDWAMTEPQQDLLADPKQRSRLVTPAFLVEAEVQFMSKESRLIRR